MKKNKFREGKDWRLELGDFRSPPEGGGMTEQQGLRS